MGAAVSVAVPRVLVQQFGWRRRCHNCWWRRRCHNRWWCRGCRAAARLAVGRLRRRSVFEPEGGEDLAYDIVELSQRKEKGAALLFRNGSCSRWRTRPPCLCMTSAHRKRWGKPVALVARLVARTLVSDRIGELRTVQCL